MTDKEKLEKVRAEVERRYNYHRDHADDWAGTSHFWSAHEDKEILSYIDSMQEEPIYTDFTKALAECIHQAQCNVFDPLVHAEIWKDELIKLAKSEEPVSEQNLSNIERTGKNWKEPVSEELEEAANNAVISLIPSFGQKNSDGSYVSSYRDCFKREEFINLFMAGAKWKEEHFEKNRLKHCNSITNEQAELEQSFIDQHLEKHQRMPTFLDAIEYGMRLQKEQLMKYAYDGAFIRRNRYNKTNVLNGFDTACDVIQSFKDKDKIKVLFVKED